MLPQWHVNDPGHCAKSTGGWLHLNTHTNLTKRSRSGLNMPLSRHSVRTRNLSGNTRRQSPQLAEPLWTDPGIKNGISVCDLISTSTNNKKQKQNKQTKKRRGLNGRAISKNPRKRGKCHHQPRGVFYASLAYDVTAVAT